MKSTWKRRLPPSPDNTHPLPGPRVRDPGDKEIAMLYLNGPAVVLDKFNVGVYPDDENPLIWYYLPMYPRVTRGSAPGNAPQLMLTKYTSERDQFAILNFDVNLGLSQDERAACAASLKQRLRDANRPLPGEPLLQPMSAKSGSVELMLLGRKSAGDTLVKGISQAAAPALYNDNRAVFSVLLDAQGSDIVEAALTRPNALQAVAVMYTLAIDGLRPAYKVKASASWKTIHDYLKQEFKQDGVFTGADIVKVIDKLKDSQAIRIDVDNLQTEDQQATAVQAMLAQVRAMIFDQFFKPAPVPEKSGPPSFLTGLTELAKTGMAAAATGGLSLIGKFSWNREDRTELLDKTLQIDLNERAMQTIKVYPQAFLSDLAGDCQTELVKEIDGGQADFFTSRQLTVDLNQNLADDGVASVLVELDYAGKKKSLLFRSGAQTLPPVSWTSSRDAQGQLVRDITLSYSVTFAPRSDGSVPAPLRAAPQVVEGDYFTVSPRSLYSLDQVRFSAAPDFNWSQYPLITLECRYEDERNHISLGYQAALYKTALDSNLSTKWTILRTDLARQSYRYRISYQQAGGATAHLGWVESDLPLVRLSPACLDLSIYPPRPGAWPDGVERIEVDLSYDDPANQLQLRRTVRIDPDQAGALQVQLLVTDATRRAVGYSVTCIGARSAKGPPSRTSQGVISLARPLQGHRFITLRAAPDLFDDGTVTKVVAKLRHLEAALPAAATELVFRPGDKNAAQNVDYDFTSDPACLCKLVYSFADGAPHTTRETDIGGADEFVINRPAD